MARGIFGQRGSRKALVGVKIDDAEFRRLIKRLGAKAPKAAASALFTVANRIMNDSKEHFVPVRTGALKNSGHVSLPEFGFRSVSVELGYGGAAAGYALAVHENLTAKHRIGSAKFLEKPMLKAIPTLGPELAKLMKQDLGGKL